MTPITRERLPSQKSSASSEKLSGESGLPPFPPLARMAVSILALPLGLLLVFGKVWLALGVAMGGIIGIALFWSLHLISRVIVEQYIGAESDRRQGVIGGNVAAVRRTALWRLGGMLMAKYAVLAIAMFGVYQIAKDHLIPVMLTFIGAFALTQITIVSAASRSMRSGR